jgi:hypothetical protein
MVRQLRIWSGGRSLVWSGGRSLVYKFLSLSDRIDLSQIILWNLTEQAGFTGFFLLYQFPNERVYTKSACGGDLVLP